MKAFSSTLHDSANRTILDILVAPTIFGPASATKQGTYIALLIDEDVDSGEAGRVQLLHYFQPNLVGTTKALTIASNITTASTIPSTEYLPPTPPGGDGPHRYTFLLFAQPQDFAIPEAYSSFIPPADVYARFPFDIEGFVKAAGLAEPVAANWFRVLNGTAEETRVALTSTGAPEATSASTANSATATTTGSSSATTSSGPSSATAAATSSSSSSNNAAGLISSKGVKELIIGLLLGVLGAGLWTL